jgi:hypothetical protein
MSFSFYGYLDQYWIDNKIKQYDLDSWEIVEMLEEYCFDSKQILSSPNPLICCIIDLIIQQLTDKLENEFSLSEELIENIREKLQDSIFTNSIDSHLGANDVFEVHQQEIMNEMLKLDPNFQVKKLIDLFEEHDF